MHKNDRSPWTDEYTTKETWGALNVPKGTRRGPCHVTILTLPTYVLFYRHTVKAWWLTTLQRQSQVIPSTVNHLGLFSRATCQIYRPYEEERGLNSLPVRLMLPATFPHNVYIRNLHWFDYRLTLSAGGYTWSVQRTYTHNHIKTENVSRFSTKCFRVKIKQRAMAGWGK